MSKKEKEEPLLTLKNDYLFKRLLGVEENKHILKDFLSATLGFQPETLEGFELLDKELKKDAIEDKMGVLDIHIRLKNETHIDLEMQQLWTPDFIPRSIFYVAKMYIEDFVAGTPYSELRKCVGVNIIAQGFNLNKEIHSEFTLQNTKTGESLGDYIRFHFFNLERLKDFPVSFEDTEENRRNNWLRFINADNKEERDMLAQGSPVLRILNEKINVVDLSKEEKRLYDSRMKLKSDITTIYEGRFKEGVKQGIEKGREEGIEQRNIFLARSFRDMGVPLDKIAKATGLSEEKIASL